MILRKRIRLVSGILAGIYVLLAFKLVVLQVIQHHHFQVQAIKSRLPSAPAAPTRGEILDRNGCILATNVQVADVYIDPTQINDPETTAGLIAQTFPIPGIEPSQLTDLITKDSAKIVYNPKTHQYDHVRYVRLIKSMPYAQVIQLEGQMKSQALMHVHNPALVNNLSGITFTWGTIRNYPYGALAAQIIGFPSKNLSGAFEAKYGVERSQNAVLSGSAGSVQAAVDDSFPSAPGSAAQSAPIYQGKTITLTLDIRIQAIAEQALNQSIKLHHAKSGSIIVLDPKTGDILAMASLPSFNPNDAAHTATQNWDDRPLTDVYEPGSTLKTLTLSAVLDKEGLQMANERVYCSGKYRVGRYTIHCAPDPPDYGVHGSEDMQDVLRNSCNIGAAQYGLQLGAVNLYHYLQQYGLLSKPATGLPLASCAHVPNPSVKHWSNIQLATISFGQGIAVTALQLASVYATIANHGVRVFPHIILGQQPPQQPYQVIKPEAASAIMTMLRAVVTDGTGKPAQVANFTVGGKTGSAQVADHGHYGDQFIGSFCGVAPITNPRLVVLCAINEPQGIHWGAVVAAPVVRTVMQQALWYLKVPPDDEGQKAYVDPPSADLELASAASAIQHGHQP